MNKDSLRPAPRKPKKVARSYKRIEDHEHQEDFILINLMLCLLLLGQAAETFWKVLTFRYGK